MGPPTRTVIVLGKGGVGRTTVAAALAAGYAARGERTLVVSPVTRADEVRARLAREGQGLEPGERLVVSEVDSRELVDGLVRTILRLGPMTDFLLNHPAYDSLMGIVPGFHELATLNYLYNEQRNGGHDRIVLDGPATGHGLHFLEAPGKSTQIMAGKLKERAEEITTVLKDPARTEVVIATLPEEMPVRETLELAKRLLEQGFPLSRIVVNRVLPPFFTDPAASRVLDGLHGDPARQARVGRAIAHTSRLDVGQWTNALALVRSQREEGATHLEALRALPVPLVEVPLHPDPHGRLRLVADALLATEVA